MATYIALQDFTANQFVFDQPNPNPQTKSFKKDDVIEASEQTNFGLQKFVVSSDGFIIPLSKVELRSVLYPAGMIVPKTFTTKNVIIGVVVIAAVFGLLKFAKVI